MTTQEILMFLIAGGSAGGLGALVPALRNFLVEATSFLRSARTLVEKGGTVTFTPAKPERVLVPVPTPMSSVVQKPLPGEHDQ